MDLVILEKVLNQAEITAEELRVEIAVHLYDHGRLSMGQATSLAGIDVLAFQKELGKRDILMKYDVEDLREDLENLKVFRAKKAS